jgi:hypothetical protein
MARIGGVRFQGTVAMLLLLCSFLVARAVESDDGTTSTYSGCGVTIIANFFS